ncbi:TetR/AcrR family transcriptional regulator C-terminal domain-containing protein [Angustibacter aerolatus]
MRTAVEYVDAHGVADLSMRRLGQQLGVEAMSLYRYVAGREDLLDAVVTEVMTAVDLDPHERLGPADGWQAFLQRMAHQVRDVALAHPKVFPLVATRSPDAPWLRPPLRTLSTVETFLEALISRGVDDATAVRMYRTFSSFLLGHLLLAVSAVGASTAPAEEPLIERTAEAVTDDHGDPLPDAPPPEERLPGLPNLQRLEPMLAEDRTAEEFEESLDALLQRLELLVP